MYETFKFYLEGIKTSNFNIKERSLFEKIIDCPIDTENAKLPIFIKDMWHEFSNVTVSGHEFLLLFNFINFVNIFFIATKSIYFAFFIAFIFEKIFIFIIGFFIKRNISKNTLIDDKFFNWLFVLFVLNIILKYQWNIDQEWQHLPALAK